MGEKEASKVKSAPPPRREPPPNPDAGQPDAGPKVLPSKDQYVGPSEKKPRSIFKPKNVAWRGALWPQEPPAGYPLSTFDLIEKARREGTIDDKKYFELKIASLYGRPVEEKYRGDRAADKSEDCATSFVDEVHGYLKKPNIDPQLKVLLKAFLKPPTFVGDRP